MTALPCCLNYTQSKVFAKALVLAFWDIGISVFKVVDPIFGVSFDYLSKITYIRMLHEMNIG